MNENKCIGRWELGCIVFNLLTFKLFLICPKIYLHFGGSGMWLTALLSGVVFLAILGIVLLIQEKNIFKYLNQKLRAAMRRIISALFIVYLIISFCVSVFFICSALQKTAFPNSPLWFTGSFIVLASAMAMICGRKAVMRMHSLCVAEIGITLLGIFLFSLQFADVYNLTPILGESVNDTLLKGLISIFMFSDIILIFALPKHKRCTNYKKTVFLSAFYGVMANVLIALVFSMNFPYEYAENIDYIIYALTKGATLNSFPIRLDFAYLISLITSSVLYASLVLSVLAEKVKLFKKKIKRVARVSLVLFMCLNLCGCYDSSEIEKKAFVIAVGIDKGKTADFLYTFQISNPLEMGKDKVNKEDSEDDSTNQNKTADNISVEADSFLAAQDKIKSILSKKVDFSNLKIAVISKEVSSEDALQHCGALLKEREIRPTANLCIAENCEVFLKNISPTLEKNTMRYYELFFKNKEVPYASEITLQEFVCKSVDKSSDGLVPVVDDENGLSKGGLFLSGELCDVIDENEMLIYNLLMGEIRNAGIDYGEGQCKISSVGKAKMRVAVNNINPYISIDLKVNVSEGADKEKVFRFLKNRAETFLYKTSSYGCDVLGAGRKVKAGFVTQKEWNEANWESLYKKSIFAVNIIVNYGKNN